MEVQDANSALLSNYKVFHLLTDLKEQRKESGKNKHSSGQQNLNTITYETLKYLSKSPCRHQSPETVREFLTAMKSHKLTNQPLVPSPASSHSFVTAPGTPVDTQGIATHSGLCCSVFSLKFIMLTECHFCKL
ncbi:PREDICTED: DNA-directed RNA polymerase III subunit RPC9-like isoform X1 [Rhinopithecus bieti]|uniref:DNA-directed RNA polymerase III subunit RPC9-like isoform X1 n=2 Tax=Rhinopithecus bieti TaxID=61621 RepID=UPI00083BED7D|nr:PREDICTED: DNA-directed RNA polymerase III subunit RPC9-like isoform X1 [Rhinopithecus bieti]